MKSLLSVNFSHAGKTYGRVYLSDKNDGSAFTQENQHLLTGFADAFAQMLAYHRSQIERERSVKALSEISQTLSAITGETFFRELVMNLGKALGVAFAFVGEVVDDQCRAIRTVVVNAGGKLVDNFIYELSGTPCENVVGKNIRFYTQGVQRLFPDDRLLVEMGIESYGVRQAHRVPRAGGGEKRPRHLRIRALPQERVSKVFLSAMRDITERKKTEDMLSRLGRILDDSHNEIYVFDAATLRFVQVNKGARLNLGFSMAELKEKTPVDLKPEFNHESFNDLIDPLRRGAQETLDFVTSHKRKDGSLYPVEVRLHLSRNEHPPVFVAIIPGRHRTPTGAGAPALSRLLRFAHRSAQSPAGQRRPLPCHAGGRKPRPPGRRHVPRSRPLQEHQRHPRA